VSCDFHSRNDIYPVSVPPRFAAILKQDVYFGVVLRAALIAQYTFPNELQYSFRRNLKIEVFEWGAIHLSVPREMLEKKSLSLFIGYSSHLDAPSLNIVEGLKAQFFSVAQRVNSAADNIMVFVRSPIAFKGVRFVLFEAETGRCCGNRLINFPW
jgi:hypothetical protein